LMRERVLGLRSRNYIIAASCLGADGWYNMKRHILPNAITPILVSAALAIPGAIMGEAGLSYLGLGVPPPAPSWGKMIADGQSLIEFAPWISIFPGICILMTTLGFNLLGDGIRDFLDPTQLH
jgi:peptide/nickel transport system permease protein